MDALSIASRCSCVCVRCTLYIGSPRCADARGAGPPPALAAPLDPPRRERASLAARAAPQIAIEARARAVHGRTEQGRSFAVQCIPGRNVRVKPPSIASGIRRLLPVYAPACRVVPETGRARLESSHSGSGTTFLNGVMTRLLAAC